MTKVQVTQTTPLVSISAPLLFLLIITVITTSTTAFYTPALIVPVRNNHNHHNNNAILQRYTHHDAAAAATIRQQVEPKCRPLSSASNSRIKSRRKMRLYSSPSDSNNQDDKKDDDDNIESSTDNNKQKEKAELEVDNMSINVDDNDGDDDDSIVNDDKNKKPTLEARVRKRVRIAEAQAKIDDILSGPDPPFDIDAEMEKVSTISPPTKTKTTSGSSAYLSELASSLKSSTAVSDADQLKNELMEAKIALLESELYDAVKQQDFEKASLRSNEISKHHIDDCGDVLQVNSAFYKAFSEKDYDAMEALWLMDRASICIHPSHKPLIGSRDIIQSWKQMFDSDNNEFKNNWIEPQDIRLTIKGTTTAIVTCDEYVYGRRFVRGKKRDTELVNKLTSTNIFRKIGNQWFMCHHHAAWHVDSEAAKMALNGESGSSSSSSSSSGGKSKSDSNDDSSAFDGILGGKSFDALLGSSDKKSASDADSDSDEPQIQRIVLGGAGMSLGDLLGGGLGDVLGGGDLTDDADSNNNNNNTNQNGDGKVGGFIKINLKDDINNDDDEIDDDDDEDDEDEENNLLGETKKIVDGKKKSLEEKIKMLESLGTKSAIRAKNKIIDSNNAAGKAKHSKDGEAAKSDGKSNNATNKKSNTLRQRCIKTLRKLCTQGTISHKQKSAILTDIITSSTKGEVSIVEVTYDLLFEGENKSTDEDDDTNDIMEEEFADQCRVWASAFTSMSVHGGSGYQE